MKKIIDRFDVFDIQRRLESGETYKSIGEDYGCHRGTIRNALLAKGLAKTSGGGPKEKRRRAAFFAKIDQSGECWEWLGRKYRGYGEYGSDNPRRAHRIMWTMENGPIPDGKVIMHKCDNPGCVNPDHLSLGTQADNIADAKKKNRTARGNGIKNSRLDEKKVRVIRARYGLRLNIEDLAKMFDVAPTTIHAVLQRRTWRHVQ